MTADRMNNLVGEINRQLSLISTKEGTSEATSRDSGVVSLQSQPPDFHYALQTFYRQAQGQSLHFQQMFSSILYHSRS